MKSLFISYRFGLSLGLMAVSACTLRAESIVDSKHNLSATSQAAIRATTETEVCVFCHTPHHGTKEAPLWNRASAGTTYTPYGSSTTKARIGQPNGASKV